MSYKKDYALASKSKKVIDLESYDDDQLNCFIRSCDRAEALKDEVVYIKAIRATLYSLGYSSDFVNGKLYDLLLKYYDFI